MSDEAVTFEYKGKAIETVGDIGKAMFDIVENGTREDATEFMKAYAAVSEYAYENVGYISGYYSPDTARKMLDWFGTRHPIFGSMEGL